MTRKLTSILILSFAILLFAFPLLSFAHEIDIWKIPPGYWGPLVSCGPGTEQVPDTDQRPCVSLCDLFHTAQHTIYFGISIALFAFAPAFFAWGGLMIIMSGGSPLEVLEGGKQGNPEMLSKGKKTLTGTVIGVLLVLGAYLIVGTFIALLGVGGPEGVQWGTISCKEPPRPPSPTPPPTTSQPSGPQWSPTNPPKNTSQADCVSNCYLPNTCAETSPNSWTCKPPADKPANPSAGVECPPGSGTMCIPPKVCRANQMITTTVYSCVDAPSSPTPSSPQGTICKISGAVCKPPKVCKAHPGSSFLPPGWETCEDP